MRTRFGPMSMVAGFSSQANLYVTTIEAWIKSWTKATTSTLGKEIRGMVPYAVLWTIRRIGNEKVFNGKMGDFEKARLEILGILWYLQSTKEL
ncbi:hypothetical protein FRX31_008023 [Thalictrum thalictroides]|uniref:Uncharacterized protein n=1 Tax=Thalictrum thalictroides TaxID=46969 RepID=A0A7J6X0T6_THATH|nr:hypothetical protein FRX31_008023 [Thalictrum thalictroides]